MAKDTKAPKEQSADDVKRLLEEAKKSDPANYNTGYWPTQGEIDDTDNAPMVSSDGAPRRYMVIEPGETAFGYYLGTEVLMMPKFGNPNEREERAFILLEVCNPPGYKGALPYGVKARRPRSTKAEIITVGETLYIGVRARLQDITMLSGLPIQPIVGIHVREKDKTSRGFNLWNFDWNAWSTDRQSLRLLADQGDNIAAIFSAQDRGLYAAEKLFGKLIPARFRAAADMQYVQRVEAGPTQATLPANAGADANAPRA